MGNVLRTNFHPGVPPRRGQLSSAMGATGDFFHHTVRQVARFTLTRLSFDDSFRLEFSFRVRLRPSVSSRILLMLRP